MPETSIVTHAISIPATTGESVATLSAVTQRANAEDEISDKEALTLIRFLIPLLKEVRRMPATPRRLVVAALGVALASAIQRKQTTQVVPLAKAANPVARTLTRGGAKP
jgi:hypothetical protein